MALVRFTLDVTPPALDEAAHAGLRALDGLSEADINARAAADPDNPPMTAKELDRLGMAAAARLSQAALAKTYRFSAARLRDLEQGRTRPDSAVLAYLSPTQRDPKEVPAPQRDTAG
jgi:putative transcriptional regulator